MTGPPRGRPAPAPFPAPAGFFGLGHSSLQWPLPPQLRHWSFCGRRQARGFSAPGGFVAKTPPVLGLPLPLPAAFTSMGIPPPPPRGRRGCRNGGAACGVLPWRSLTTTSIISIWPCVSMAHCRTASYSAGSPRGSPSIILASLMLFSP